VKPNTTAWLAWRALGVTASDTTAILGLSPWASRFDLWWRKHHDRAVLADGGVLTEREPSQRFAIGHALEPVLHRFFTGEVLPEGWRLGSGGCWQGRGVLSWLRATPDRCVYPDRRGRRPVALVEFKTSAGFDEFGDDPGDGVPDIPAHYRAQMIHQMATVGVGRGWLTVLTHQMEVRHYEVVAQPGEVDLVIDSAHDFHRSLSEGRTPDVDGHEATTAALKGRHHGDAHGDIAVTDDLAAAYRQAVAAAKHAKAAEDLAKNQLLAAMGDGKRAIDGHGAVVATRSVSYRRGIDRARLQADHPDLFADYYQPSTTPTIRLTPARQATPGTPITQPKESKP
jgi:predicted phage-related endonuclease